MDLKYILITATVMCVCTVLPRIIPITFFTHRVKSRFIKSFLHYVPSAILSAMVFPAIFFATGNIITATVSTAVALILAFIKKIPFFIVAIVSVIVVFGLSFAF